MSKYTLKKGIECAKQRAPRLGQKVAVYLEQGSNDVITQVLKAAAPKNCELVAVCDEHGQLVIFERFKEQNLESEE